MPTVIHQPAVLYYSGVGDQILQSNLNLPSALLLCDLIRPFIVSTTGCKF